MLKQMIATPTPGAIKKFRRTTWRFQQTFETPLDDLDRFVKIILAGVGEINSGTVIMDGYVFEPKHLLALVKPETALGHDVSLSADSWEEVVELLKASFWDWLDFIFIPQPKLFVIYADHDEYATFFAASKSNLNRATAKLVEAGFKQVEGFQRDV